MLIHVKTRVANSLVRNPGALYVFWAGANNDAFAGITDSTIPISRDAKQEKLGISGDNV